MRFAVCDDFQPDLLQISGLLTLLEPDAKIDCFSSAQALYDSTQQNTYDAVFLDIEMEAPNGFDIALQLVRADQHPLILFVTNSAAYAVRGYGIALRYLLKPLTPDALSEALEAIHRELRSSRLTFLVDGNTHVFHVHDILYAEVTGHRVFLHTASGKLAYRASLKELAAQLPGRWFSMPHQSYIVNMLHVRSVSALSLSLTNGTEIPISRRKQQEFLSNFHRFLGV